MKFSNEKMLIDIERLGYLSQKELPVKVSYAIAKNINKIEKELKVYGHERNKLIDKYAKKDTKGNAVSDEHGQIVFKENCKEQWDKDIRDLLDIEVEIDVHKFNISILENSNCIMTPAELMLINYMIEE